MGKAEVDAIIADVFRVSGIKLTADDPVIAILLVQESRLKALFEEQRNRTREDFDGITAEIEEPWIRISSATLGYQWLEQVQE